MFANRPNNVNTLMQLKPNIVTQEITHAAPNTNNFPDFLVQPVRSEPHQHQLPTTEDPEHLNPGPATNILQIQQPDAIYHNPIEPAAREEDINLETPPTCVRYSKYPLRHREPKRQWDESLQSTVEAFEPEIYMDAMNAPDRQQWKKAIQEEYDSLLNNHTWTITTLPTNRFSVIKQPPNTSGN